MFQKKWIEIQLCGLEGFFCPFSIWQNSAWTFVLQLTIRKREFPVPSLQTAQPHVIPDHNKLIYLNKNNDLLSFLQPQQQNPM